MNRNHLNLLERQALDDLPMPSAGAPSFADWIRLFRKYLRMTQAELAKRAGIPQSHIVKIENGKTDVQVGTLQKIFKALSCDLAIQPRPHKSIDEILRGRARAVALKRLKQSMGTMALEGQAAQAETFRGLLEKMTDEILSDPREKLWNKN